MTEALLIGLAAWRLASLLVYENGPGHVFDRLRRFMGVGEGLVEGFWAELFSCIWCMTIYTAVFAYLLWLVEPIIVKIIAGAAVALLVENLVKKE